MQAISEYVWLRGGLAVPVAPVRLLFDLEDRGFRFERLGSDIVIRPFSRLTDEDRLALERWKPHVLALLDYRPPKVS